jgi:hypothetical protein
MRDLGSALGHEEPCPIRHAIQCSSVAGSSARRRYVLAQRARPMRLSSSRAARGRADRVASVNSPPCCSLRCPLCSTLRTQVGYRACLGSRGTSVLHRSRYRQPAPACRFGAMNGRAQLMVPQLKTFYSIASSAVASSEGGTSRSSILAVFKLTTSSNLVGNCTGRSAGFSPLRIRSA